MTKKSNHRSQIGKYIRANSKSTPSEENNATYTIVQLMDDDDVFIVKWDQSARINNEVDPSWALIYENYINKMRAIRLLTSNNDKFPNYLVNYSLYDSQHDGGIHLQCIQQDNETISISPQSSRVCSIDESYRCFTDPIQISNQLCQSSYTKNFPSSNLTPNYNEASIMFAPATLEEVLLKVVNNELIVKVDTSHSEKKQKSKEGNAKLVATVQYNLDEVPL